MLNGNYSMYCGPERAMTWALAKAELCELAFGAVQAIATGRQVPNRKASVWHGLAMQKCETPNPRRIALDLLRLNISRMASIKVERLLAATCDEYRAELPGFEFEDEADDPGNRS